MSWWSGTLVGGLGSNLTCPVCGHGTSLCLSFPICEMCVLIVKPTWSVWNHNDHSPLNNKNCQYLPGSPTSSLEFQHRALLDNPDLLSSSGSHLPYPVPLGCSVATHSPQAPPPSFTSHEAIMTPLSFESSSVKRDPQRMPVSQRTYQTVANFLCWLAWV